MSEEKPAFKWKELLVSWDGENGYIAKSESGAVTVMMGKGGAPNDKPGITPTEMPLAGMAGCTMVDVLSILNKKRQYPTAFDVKVRGKQRLTEYPYFYYEFEMEYILWGEGLVAKDVEQAIHLSEEKYCSVGATLAKAGPIRTSYRILPPGESA